MHVQHTCKHIHVQYFHWVFLMTPSQEIHSYTWVQLIVYVTIFFNEEISLSKKLYERDVEKMGVGVELQINTKIKNK